MKALELAGLGATGGTGESLVSWLCAGPLGASALELAGLGPITVNGDGRQKGRLFCPACRLDEPSRRRWYSRAEWEDPHCVICSAHAIPLVWCATTPARLRGRRWPVELRAEFHAINQWTRKWSDSGLCRRTGGVGRPELAVLRAILAPTDPRIPYSRAFAEAQWHLWLEGWPVPSGPLFPARRRALPARQPDRLAVMAITHRVCLGLQTGRAPNWPPLPIRPRTLARLRACLHQLHPAWNEHLACCFKQDL